MSSKFEEALEQKLRCLDRIRSNEGMSDLAWVAQDMGMVERDIVELFVLTVKGSLEDGVPYYWTEEVLETLEAVYMTLDDVRMTFPDLPTPTGFLYFSRPVCMGADEKGNPRMVHAMSWICGREASDVEIEGDGDVGIGKVSPTTVTNVAFVCYTRQMFDRLFPVSWINYTLGSSLSDHSIQAVGDQPDYMGTEEYQGLIAFSEMQLKFVMSAFLFLTQPAFRIEEKALPRHTRRRIEARRTERRHDGVRVVYLRKPERRPSGETHEVNWTHRWWVKMHWRTYRNEDGSIRRRTLILPHIKGPSHLDLKAPDQTIFAVVR